MPNQTSYDYISEKINSMKSTYSSLRNKAEAYVFSALCVKSNYYKNPALILSESDLQEIIVDGQYDGGVDFMLTDPNSESSDLVIGQSKYYQNVSSEDVLNALLKMALFYKDMIRGHYEQVNPIVQRRFLSLNSEVGEESKIHFVFYTSAPQSGIRRDRIEKKFKEQFSDMDNVELSILFGPDIEDEIKESESRRPTVESGKIKIDHRANYLSYGDNAAIVNASAYSIKQLYAQHSTTLLARNLRYHVPGRDIDKAISDTISNEPETFWLKNNGITIVCDEFDIDGNEVKLRNFSVVNGGQTTYMIHKSPSINSEHDLYLPCKIITIEGETEDEKNLFSLSIAKATNSQKAIKPVDLKANSPEQVRFANEMRNVGIFYQTKRGEIVPSNFRSPHLNTDLMEVGKLCLAAIFQIPCASRNKPSTLYLEKYYNPIFNGNQRQIASLCKELLYIDNYYRTTFQKQFDQENSLLPNASERISFAHNARTICIAFVAFVSRYNQGNIVDTSLAPLFSRTSTDSISDTLYETFKDLGSIQHFFDPALFSDKDKYESVLKRLFSIIIDAGVMSFGFEARHDTTLNATNYLKKDKNYYDILASDWSRTMSNAQAVLQNI